MTFLPFHIMRKQRKGKSKDNAPKGSPPITKLILRVPAFSSATQAVPSTSPSLRTPKIAPEAGPLQLDTDTYYLPEISYSTPSPRQQFIDQCWEDDNRNTTNVQEPSESNHKEDPPNEATSYPENAKDPLSDPGPGLPAMPDAGASGKRKASTHSLERSSSVNPDSVALVSRDNA